MEMMVMMVMMTTMIVMMVTMMMMMMIADSDYGSCWIVIRVMITIMIYSKHPAAIINTGIVKRHDHHRRHRHQSAFVFSVLCFRATPLLPHSMRWRVSGSLHVVPSACPSADRFASEPFRRNTHSS